MERTEFIQKMHELKTKQYEIAYQFKNKHLERQQLEKAEIEAENNRFAELKKESQANLERIRSRYQIANHNEKQGLSIRQQEIENEIAQLKMQFFAEHPEENLSIMRS